MWVSRDEYQRLQRAHDELAAAQRNLERLRAEIKAEREQDPLPTYITIEQTTEACRALGLPPEPVRSVFIRPGEVEVVLSGPGGVTRTVLIPHGPKRREA